MTRRNGTSCRVVTLLAVGGVVVPGAAAQDIVDLPAEDRILEPSVETLYSVGSIDGEAWEIFGRIPRVGFDGRGLLHIFDPDNHRVVVVGRDGELVREFGQQGDGPGEWRNPVDMAVLRDGRTVVTDVGHRALMVHDSEGAFTHPVPLMGPGGGIMRFGGLEPDPRGGALVGGGGGGMIRIGGAGGPGGPPRGRPVERVEIDGDRGRSVLYAAWEPPPSPERARSVSAGGGASFAIGAGPRVFEPSLHTAPLLDGGVAVVDSSTWAVKIVGPGGALVRVIRRPLAPSRVTPAIEEAERQRLLEELQSGEGPEMRVVVSRGGGEARPVPQGQIREMQERQIAEREFYPEIPVVTGLATGWGGRVWVARRGDDPSARGPVDLVDPEGSYVGTLSRGDLRLPAAFGPDGLVAWIERDELDVATVVVGRLPTELR